MREKKLHINSLLKGNYPQPDIPASDAWAHMSNLLDENINNTPPPPPTPPNGGSGFGKYAALFLITASIIAFWLWHNKKNSPPPALMTEERHEQKNDTMMPAKNKSFTQLNSTNNNSTADSILITSNPITKNTAQKNIKNNDEINAVDKAKNNYAETDLNHTKIEKILRDRNNKNTDKNYEPTLIANPTTKLLNSKQKNVTKTSFHNKSKNKNSVANNLSFSKSDINNSKKIAAKKNKKTNKQDALSNKQNDHLSDVINRAETQNTVQGHLPSNVDISKNNPSIKDDNASQIVPMANNNDSTYSEKIKSEGAISTLAKKDSATLANTNKLGKAIAKNNKSKAKKTSSKNKKNLSEFNYGLQWNAALPINGTANYFTGSNGQSAPYNFLIPELWVSKNWGKKHAVQVLFNPQQQVNAHNKQIAFYNGPLSISDSTPVNKITQLTKSTGMAASLQYNYFITSKLSAGIGINYFWNNKTLINKKITEILTGIALPDSVYSITKSSADWQYIKNSVLSGKIEMAYSLHKFQIGAAAFIPISAMAGNSNNTIKPINAQIFFRWKIK